MIKFRKLFNAKIITVLVAVTFFFNSTAYGIDLSNKSHLRKHLDFNKKKIVPRYLCLMLSSAIGESIRETIRDGDNNQVLMTDMGLDRIDIRFTPRRLLQQEYGTNYNDLMRQVKENNIQMQLDNEGNIWIYHEPDNIYIVIDKNGKVESEDADVEGFTNAEIVKSGWTASREKESLAEPLGHLAGQDIATATSLFVFDPAWRWDGYPELRQALIASLNTEDRNHLIWEALNNTLLWKAYQGLQVLPKEFRRGLTEDEFIQVLNNHREIISQMLNELWPDEETRPNVVLALGADRAAEYDSISDTIFIDLRASPLIQLLALQDEITHAQMETDDELRSIIDQARLLRESFLLGFLTPERITLALQRSRVLGIEEEIASLLESILPDKDVDQIQADLMQGRLDPDALSEEITKTAFNRGDDFNDLVERLFELSDYPEAEQMGIDIKGLFKKKAAGERGAELEEVARLIETAPLYEEQIDLKRAVQDAREHGMDLAGLFDLLFAISIDDEELARQQYDGWREHFYPAEDETEAPAAEEDLNLREIQNEYSALLPAEAAHDLTFKVRGRPFTVLEIGNHDLESFFKMLDKGKAAQEILGSVDGLILRGYFESEVIRIIEAIEDRYGQKLILQDIDGTLSVPRRKDFQFQGVLSLQRTQRDYDELLRKNGAQGLTPALKTLGLRGKRPSLGREFFTVLSMDQNNAETFLSQLNESRLTQDLLGFVDGLIVMGVLDEEMVKVIEVIEERFGQKVILQDIGGKLIPIQINARPGRKMARKKPLVQLGKWNVDRDPLLILGALGTAASLAVLLSRTPEYFATTTQEILHPVEPPWTQTSTGRWEIDPSKKLKVTWEYEFMLFNTKLPTPFKGKPISLGKESHPDWEGATLYVTIPETEGDYGYKVRLVGPSILEYTLPQPGIYEISIPSKDPEKYRLEVEAYQPSALGQWDLEMLKAAARGSRRVKKSLSVKVHVVGPYQGIPGQGPVISVVKTGQEPANAMQGEGSEAGRTAVEELESAVTEIQALQTRREADRGQDVRVEGQTQSMDHISSLEQESMLLVAGLAHYEEGYRLFHEELEAFKAQPLPDYAELGDKGFQEAMSHRIAKFVALARQAQALDLEREALKTQAEDVTTRVAEHEEQEGKDKALYITLDELRERVDKAGLQREESLQNKLMLDMAIGYYPDEWDAGVLKLLLEVLAKELGDTEGMEPLQVDIGRLRQRLGHCGRVMEAEALEQGLSSEAVTLVRETAEKIEQLDAEGDLHDDTGGVTAKEWLMARPLKFFDGMLNDPPSIGMEDASTPEEFIHQLAYYLGFTETAIEKLQRTKFIIASTELGAGGGRGGRDIIKLWGFQIEAATHEAKHDFWFTVMEDEGYCQRIYGISPRELRERLYRVMLESAWHYRSPEFPEGDPEYPWPLIAKRSYFTLFGDLYNKWSAVDAPIKPWNTVEKNLQIMLNNENDVDHAHLHTTFWPFDIQEDMLPPELWWFFEPIYTGEPWLRAELRDLQKEHPGQVTGYCEEGSYLEQEAVRWFLDWSDNFDKAHPDVAPLRAQPSKLVLSEQVVNETVAEVDVLHEEVAREVQVATEDTVFVEMVRMKGSRWLDNYVGGITPEDRARLGPRLEALGNTPNVAELWMQTNGNAIRLLMHSTMPPEIRTLVQKQVPPVKLLHELRLLPWSDATISHDLLQEMPQTAEGLWQWLDKLESEATIRGWPPGVNIQAWLANMNQLKPGQGFYVSKEGAALMKFDNVVYEALAWMAQRYPAETSAIFDQTQASLAMLQMNFPEISFELIRNHPKLFVGEFLKPKLYGQVPQSFFVSFMDEDPALAAKLFLELDKFEPPEGAKYTADQARRLVIGDIFQQPGTKEAEFLHELLQQEDGREWLEAFLMDENTLVKISEATAPNKLENRATALINSLDNQQARDELGEVLNVALDAWGQLALTRQDDGVWVTQTDYGRQPEHLIVAAPVVLRHSKPIMNVRYGGNDNIFAEDIDRKILEFKKEPDGWELKGGFFLEPDRNLEAGESIAPDGKTRVTPTNWGSAIVEQMDVNGTWKTITTLHDEEANWVNSAAFSPDGTEFVLVVTIDGPNGQQEGTIEIYQLDSFEPFVKLEDARSTEYVLKDSFSPDLDELTEIVVSPDSGSIAVFEGYHELMVHNTGTWDERFDLGIEWISATFAPKWGTPSTPDKQRLAVGSATGSIAILIPEKDVDVNERRVLMLYIHEVPVVSVVFSHGGNLLASGDSYGKVVIHQYNRSNDDWEKVAEFNAFDGEAITNLAFLPDDRTLVIAAIDFTSSYGTKYRADSTTFFRLQDGAWERSDVESQFSGGDVIGLSPDGNAMVLERAYGESLEILYRKPDGDWQRIFYEERFGNVVDASFSSDSQNLAVLTKDSRVVVFNKQQNGAWKEIYEFTHPCASQVALSDNGEQLFVGAMPEEADAPTISIYELQAQELLLLQEAPEDSSSAAYGALIARRETLHFTLGLAMSNFSITYSDSEDTARLMALDNTSGTKYYWTKVDGAPQLLKEEKIISAPGTDPGAWPDLWPLPRLNTPLGTFKLNMTDGLVIQQMDSGGSWKTVITAKENEFIMNTAFSPDGTEVAVAVVFLDSDGNIIDGKGEIRIYPLEQFQREEMPATALSYEMSQSWNVEGDFRDAAYSGDGRVLVTAGGAGTVVYEKDDRDWIKFEVLSAPAGLGLSEINEQVAVSDDGHIIVTVDSEGGTGIYNMAERVVSRLDGVFTHAELSPTWKILAVGRADGTVEFQRPYEDSWLPFETFEYPGNPVTAITFSLDGTRLLISRKNGNIMLHERDDDIFPSKGISIFETGGDASSNIAFSPNGNIFTGEQTGNYLILHEVDLEFIYDTPLDVGGVVKGLAFSSDNELVVEAEAPGGNSILWRFYYDSTADEWEREEIMTFDSPSIQTVFQEGASEFARVVESPETGQPVLEIYFLTLTLLRATPKTARKFQFDDLSDKQAMMRHIYVFLADEVLNKTEEFRSIYDSLSRENRIVIIAVDDKQVELLKAEGFTNDNVDILVMTEHLREFDIVDIKRDIDTALAERLEEIGHFTAHCLDYINSLNPDLAEQILSGV